MNTRKLALITGSGKRRVGWHVADALARRGYRLAIHYRSSAAEAQQTVAEFQQRDVEAASFGADLTPLAATSMWARVTWTAAAAWMAQIVVALILAQTLVFKFTYAPETQVIFASRGGRPAATAVGAIELGCAILLLTPRFSAIGALLSLLVISGAIFTHLTSLGIEVVDPTTGQGDRGLLFGLAVAVAVGSISVVWLRWRQLPWIGSRVTY